ncbi:protein GDAP2 homolog [Rhagoletis pomonella]|uniref:protein GDAP2 homolog n=1 Tax=Rhagoletis pomonella TaxID=28610 RepID=UPI00177F7604|nr:protein GDAP2 homolog [Rhagoletis pomonella]
MRLNYGDYGWCSWISLEGDITTLEVDGITNIIEETQNETNPIAERIYAAAGNQLKEELSNNLKECRTGEVCVTRGYNLSAKCVLHTVGPAVKETFKSAAESTLHYSYRNALYKAKELNLRTIAISNLSANQSSFPADLAGHIALRTIRRFLDKYLTQIVILCVSAHERGIYEVLAPLYFPRDHLEERSALWQLPKDIGGEFGEPQHPDRQIRIIRNPQHSVLMRHVDSDLYSKGIQIQIASLASLSYVETPLCWVPGHNNINSNEIAEIQIREVDNSLLPPISFLLQGIEEYTEAVTNGLCK